MRLSILFLGLAGVSAFAQANIKGKFVFTEEGTRGDGQRYAALANLSFDENGTVVGNEVLRAKDSTTFYTVQGTYTMRTDNTGSITLTLISDEDADGNRSHMTENLSVFRSASGEIAAVRSNAGFNGAARLSPAPAQGPNGDYLLVESSADGFARAARIKIDALNVTGDEVKQTNGESSSRKAQGTRMPDVPGFAKIMLSFSATDAEGTISTTTETLLVLATADGARAIRTDGMASGVLGLIR